MKRFSTIPSETVKGLRDQLNDLIKQGFADSTVLIFDPDIKEWSTVTGLTYGGDDCLVKLYSDKDEDKYIDKDEAIAKFSKAYDHDPKQCESILAQLDRTMNPPKKIY